MEKGCHKRYLAGHLPYQWFYPTVTFPIDHVVARQHGGPTRLGNLALARPHCNSHKGPNLAGIDPATNRITKLFNPRRHKWGRHFRLDGAVFVGKTAVGRTTIAVLNLNDPDLIQARAELIEETGAYPSL